MNQYKKTLFQFIVPLFGLFLLVSCGNESSHTTVEDDVKADRAVQHESDRTLYICPMHPNVISEEQGDCPICGMDLVQAKTSGEAEAHEGHDHDDTQMSADTLHATQYTCPMHPDVVSDEPGECPECGMDLVPMDEPAASGESQGEHQHEQMSTQQERAQSASSAGTEEGQQLYTCSMHPNVVQEGPGDCPICGMDLVPMKRAPSAEGAGAAGMTVTVDPVVVQNMGVRKEMVQRRNLSREIRALGRVTFDETRLAHIHTKVDGYIERAYVQATGTRVEAGEPLVEIYSPEMVATQEEYLQAYRNVSQAGVISQGSKDLLASARRRLEFWDISARQISQLEQTGEVSKTLTLNSPFSGVVVLTEAIEGMRVQPGMHLYRIADLSEVWVEADIYEYELPWLKEGQPVSMDLSYSPGVQYNGSVEYIYPYLESKTRTVKVRSVFDNNDGMLKPGMYANLNIESQIEENAVAIPEEAVIFSGERAIAFIALGEGRFEPRDLQLGALSGDGYYAVQGGIHEGEEIVTSGQFLLDSESKLQEALQKMLSRNRSGEEAAASMQGHNH